MHYTGGTVRYRHFGRLHELPFSPAAPAQDDYIRLTLTDEPCPLGRRTRLTIQALSVLTLETVELTAPLALDPADHLYLNGFQSWSYARAERPAQVREQPPAWWARFMAQAYGDYAFAPYNNQPGELHGWTYGLRYPAQPDAPTTLWASLAEQTGYTLWVYRHQNQTLTVSKDCQGRGLSPDDAQPYLAFDLVWLTGPEADLLPAYQAQLGRPQGCAPTPPPPATGWTSWYYHYTKIDETLIGNNIRAFADRQLPIDFIQIDDGWQPAVGDWLATNAKFPNGMGLLAEQIHTAGFRAGLWLAPFICEAKSSICKEHPSWLLRGENGAPLKAGFNPLWGGWLRPYYYALDFLNPEVQDYVRRCFDLALHTWNFDLLKLDFLYAATLQTPPSHTRGELMDQAMAFLRECAGPDKLLLGCGVPLAPAAARTDYCRIGPDISLGWDLAYLKLTKARERISTAHTLHNTVSRRHLDGQFFRNDPDVFILRQKGQKLTLTQQYTLLVVNHLYGGLVFTSDDPSEYSDDTLALYRTCFPHRTKQLGAVLQPQPDTYDAAFGLHIPAPDGTDGPGLQLQYRALINMGGKAVNLTLPETGLWYEARADKFHTGGPQLLAPYQTRVFLHIDAHQEGDTWHVSRPQLAYSTGHLFPGAELATAAIGPEGWAVTRHPQAAKGHQVGFVAPTGPGSQLINRELASLRADAPKGLAIAQWL